jgi:DNA topoisomerase-3
VLGHVMGVDFPETTKKWYETDMESLFHIPLVKQPIENSTPIVQNIKTFSKDSDCLVIWTDCDREGEAIGFDIIDLAKSVKPRIDIYRAHFSALTREEIERATSNLQRPNKNLADAVRVRQEIDLRIGASFTRFQTLTLRDLVPNKKGVISYGPCQFPTLGFIVERDKQIKQFKPEKFWFIDLQYTSAANKNETASFQWERNRLFDKQCTTILFLKVKAAQMAKVTNVMKKRVTKFKPYPLNTVEA